MKNRTKKCECSAFKDKQQAELAELRKFRRKIEELVPRITNGEIMSILENCARKWRINAKKSLVRSGELPGIKEEAISQDIVDAVLVNYINYVVHTWMGGDFSLHVRHIRKPKKK